MSQRPSPKGRGSHLNPPNRFALTHREDDPDAPPDDIAGSRHPQTEFILERSRSLVTENNSPDIPFRYSINPYRGCEHGCAYCYARPYHEFLGYNAGLDFETKIVVKENAPELFREFLARDTWQPEAIALSGVTDCYQPCERRFRLTRGCLEVAAAACQPMSIITKNALVVRDLDLLRDMAAQKLIHVTLSVTTLDAELAHSMEPRTSTPAARLAAMRTLANAGVPVRVMVAPIIPGLNDSEIPAILAAAKEAGAGAAGWTLLRLPLTVAPVFREWLEREKPERVERVVGRVRDSHGGKLNNPEFGERMRGTGEMARHIGDVFRLFARRYGLDGELTPYDCSRFRPPPTGSGQLKLF
jgi:DNA repair photolyase